MVNTEDIRAAIKNSGVDIDADSIPVDQPFGDLGLDSLDRFNVFLEVEESFGIQIPDEQIENLQTIKAIESFLNNS